MYTPGNQSEVNRNAVADELLNQVIVLPPEVWAYIMQFLNVKDLATLRSVDQARKAIVGDWGKQWLRYIEETKTKLTDISKQVEDPSSTDDDRVSELIKAWTAGAEEFKAARGKTTFPTDWEAGNTAVAALKELISEQGWAISRWFGGPGRSERYNELLDRFNKIWNDHLTWIS